MHEVDAVAQARSTHCLHVLVPELVEAEDDEEGDGDV